MTDQEKTITLQRGIIKGLRSSLIATESENKQLKADNAELIQILALAIGRRRIVISRDRLREINVIFSQEENIEGEIIISIGGMK